MKIYAMFPYWDESPIMLGSCVASLAKLCDHVIAVDGGFQMFPGTGGNSGVISTRAITDAADAVDLGLTLVHLQKNDNWKGNEVGKRNAVFKLAHALASPDDWFLLLDADEVLAEVRGDIRGQLAETDLDAAEGTLRTYVDPQQSEHHLAVAQMSGASAWANGPERRLFRAHPTFKAVSNHYTYTIDKGNGPELLHGFNPGPDGNPLPLAPALDLNSMVVVEHRRQLRTKERVDRADGFYQRRDDYGLESYWTPDNEGANDGNG